MQRMSLPLAQGKRPHRPPPTMPNASCVDLGRALTRATNLDECLSLLKRFTALFPDTSWAYYLNRLYDGLLERRAVSPIFDLVGNIKVPFICFSSLSDVDCPGAGECRDWCYSKTGWRYPAPFTRQLQNSLLLRWLPGLVCRAWLELPKGGLVRLYVDGDFYSYHAVAWWMERLRERPDLLVFGYSKSWDELWAWHRAHKGRWPRNYVLNLSTGVKERQVTREQMLRLPITRGDFVSLPVPYRPEGVVGNVGHQRYDDPEYHRMVRNAAKTAGLGRVLSCPGHCGTCCGGQPACANQKLKGLTIAIGIH